MDNRHGICLQLQRMNDSGWTMQNFIGDLPKRLLYFKDEYVVDFVSELQLAHKTSMIIDGHHPQSVPRKVKITCCVCNLERQFLKASSSENMDK